MRLVGRFNYIKIKKQINLEQSHSLIIRELLHYTSIVVYPFTKTFRLNRYASKFSNLIFFHKKFIKNITARNVRYFAIEWNACA